MCVFVCVCVKERERVCLRFVFLRMGESLCKTNLQDVLEFVSIYVCYACENERETL